MKIEVPASDVLEELPVDSRGRVCLGSAYKDCETATVAVVEVEDG